MLEDPERPRGDLLVCGVCARVKGPVPSRTPSWVQLCSCAPTEERRTQPRYGDFNCWVELCYCCGLNTVPSGSRWSPFHCESCRKRVRSLNYLVGRCAIPVGRHSIMNGVFLGDATQRTHEAFVAFSDQIQTLFTSIDHLSEWARAMVLTNLTVLGYEKGVDVYLDTYLSEAKRRRFSRARAFNSLVERIFGPDDGKLLISLCRNGTTLKSDL
jgi:hypothetical protein